LEKIPHIGLEKKKRKMGIWGWPSHTEGAKGGGRATVPPNFFFFFSFFFCFCFFFYEFILKNKKFN
jgi:hypothetical protein